MGSSPSSANTSNTNATYVTTDNSPVTHPAYLATANTVTDPNWYMDSGASTHITNTQANLDQVTLSYGKEEITVGNGVKTFCKSNCHSYYFMHISKSQIKKCPTCTKCH